MKRLVLLLACSLLAACSSWSSGQSYTPTASTGVPDTLPFRPASPIAITLHNGLKRDPVPYFERSNCGANPWPLEPFSASVPAGDNKTVIQDFAATCFVQPGQFAAISLRASLLLQATWCEVRAEDIDGRIAFTLDYKGSDSNCTLTSDGLSANLDYSLKQ